MNKRAYRRLDHEDRIIIQACLYKNFSLSEIAKRLDVHKSTVSRELKRNTFLEKGENPYLCPTQEKLIVCNTCNKKKICTSTKRYYNFQYAINLSEERKVNSRSRTKLSEKEIQQIDEFVKEGVSLGQSLHHIYITHPILKTMCSERTIRRLIYRGYLSTKAYELRQYVVYKREYKKPAGIVNLRNLGILVDRSYKDYTKYCFNNKSKHIVHYDSLNGKQSDKFAILTIGFIKYNFQFGLLIKKGDPSSVNHTLRRLFKKLGNEVVKEVFAVNLCDNGTEFSSFYKLEVNKEGEVLLRTFYTNPYKATDKAKIERNHGLVRYLFPKGKSLDKLRQEEVDIAFSHLNSYVRKSLSDQTPYDLVKRKFGKELLNQLNIIRVPKKKVKLHPIV